jgi:Cdc6-like AAA superfamily ATPase
VKTAFHDRTGGPSPCLGGTRVHLLEDVATWMADPDNKTVFWMTGAAGTGKTTVAKSVADMASKEKYVVVAFFFSHAYADRRDYNKVIPTIAYQLAQDAGLRPPIVAAIDSDKNIATSSTAVQAKKLLFDGLRAPSSPIERGVLIVLDALDEHLLHWIEVLSLTSNLYAVQRTMLDLMSVTNVCSFLPMNKL